MNLRQIDGPPDAALARMLAEFERGFRYPLGPGRSFHIDHGADYPRFFRAIGPAACFIAEQDGRVCGTFAVALCGLLRPDGTEQRAAYLGDLKLSPTARGGFVLCRLVQAARAWVGDRTNAAFCVVMDGTPVVPTAYTGRVGIPALRELGKVHIWRISTPLTRLHGVDTLTPGDGAACFRRLSRGRYAPLGGRPGERSEAPPAWLLEPQGLACGRWEDTRRGKRLVADDGAEMRSAHLSCFAWQTPAAGAAILRAALRLSAERDFPALFVSVTEADGRRLRPLLSELEIVVAPATIYGAGLVSGHDWNIHTAEV